jgi:HAD superfamily hydrolase (TIGR01509 family)
LGVKSGEKRGSPEAVIWDFDGVILDDELLHVEAEMETARSFGIALTREIAFEYLGVRLEDYFRDLIRRYGADTSLEEMLREHFAVLRRCYGDSFPLSPHMREVLEALEPILPMGIATNRERELVEIALGRFSISPYFNAVVCKEEVRNGKPAPDSFLQVASALGSSPRLTVVVEDSETGFEAAKRAGMKLVARKAAHNGHLNFSMADFVVEDLRDVVKIVRRGF